MPAMPWTVVDPSAPAEVLVMASRFRVRSWRQVVPFLRDAMAVHAQVRRSPGAVGVTLDAHPLRREFFTLSTWHDRAALQAMVRAEPHASVMRRHRAGAESVFVFWTAPGGTPPTWDEARSRLAAARA